MSEDKNWTEELAEIQQAAWDSSTRAAEAAEELGQRLSAELFATQGDDAMAKAALARSRYQRDLAEVSYEYWRDTAEQRREAAAIYEAAQADAVASAYVAFLEQIDQSVADIAGSESDPKSASTQPKRKGRSTSSRTRTPSRSAKAEK